MHLAGNLILGFAKNVRTELNSVLQMQLMYACLREHEQVQRTFKASALLRVRTFRITNASTSNVAVYGEHWERRNARCERKRARNALWKACLAHLTAESATHGLICQTIMSSKRYSSSMIVVECHCERTLSARRLGSKRMK